MFFHRQEVQYKATPEPDAVYARKLQEGLGQYGEITVV